MELQSHVSDSRVSREDFLLPRPIPTMVGSEMSRSAFLEMVGDPLRNRRSLELIVQSYEDCFAYDDRIDDYLGSGEDPGEELPAPVDAIWFDRDILEELLTKTHHLLSGDFCLENLDSSTRLIAAYYSLCQTNITRYLEIIEDMHDGARECRNVVSHLEIEKNEAETLEEIAANIEQINSCISVGDEVHELLLSEMEHVKRALKASYYVSSLGSPGC